MCGLAGFVSTKKSSTEELSLLNRMLAVIGHRGPDARNLEVYDEHVHLGHNRLSIIDLSNDGTQPIEKDGCSIVFNGEIYNYIEIRAELLQKGYSFKTATDTEVIIAAYKEYGFECVSKFVGMWSFALYDSHKKLLFCSRDHFGIKPFYYYQDYTGFYFASEYKSFFEVSTFNKTINTNQVSRALQFGWLCYKDETFLSSLKSLEPGYNLILQEGKIAIRQYWDLQKVESPQLSATEAQRRLEAQIIDSVKLHMRADVEVGVCLSGGIDSSILTGVIGTHLPRLKFKTFSIYYEGKGKVDEREYMHAVVDKYPQIDADYYQPTENEVLDNLGEIIKMADVPITGSSNISHYFLTKRIHEKGVKVVLDGQGVDEYFCGYQHAGYRFFADLLNSGNITSFVSEVNMLRKKKALPLSGVMDLCGKSFLSTILSEQAIHEFEYKHYYPNVIDNNLTPPFKLTAEPGLTKLQQFSKHMLFCTSLPTILHYVDRMTMAHSLESRVPFLDHRLVTLGYSLPNNFKVKRGTTKYLLRESAKSVLPEKVYSRNDKKGFVTPGENIWLRTSLRHLLEFDFSVIPYIDKKKTQKVINRYLHGSNKDARLVWRLAMLHYWVKLNKLG
ncbi:MAG: asparagine synthase (glutamine-hydrolyzing) [Chitinophagales bacterium]